jgi:tRNA pseudouridine38-40 synthase
MNITYNGAEYHGFQVQNNARAVANVIEEALFKLTGEKISVTGCSRTDAGVHAEEFYLNFHTESALSENNFLRGMNTYLPKDVAVREVREVPEEFHARFSAKSKEYRYLILNSAVRDPFFEKRALFYNRRIDEELLDKECKALLGTHDFSAFCSAGGTTKTNVRTVIDCSVKRSGDIVEIRISADGFLYNMVRIIVGTLLAINEGKIEAGSIRGIIESKDRSLAGDTASGEGLYLSRVNY